MGETTLYWSVNDDYTIHATTDIMNASPFFIIPNDEGSNAYEFHIAYRQPSQGEQASSSMEPILRYLSAPLTICGVNMGPLQLKHLIMEEGRLVLETRIGKDKGPVNPQNWVNGREAFFVRCARRRFKRDGYICVKQQGRGEWITACVPFKFFHDERDTFMLFRLLPTYYREQQSQNASGTHTEDAVHVPNNPTSKLKDELDLLTRGSAPEKFRVHVIKQEVVQQKQPDDSERLIRTSS